MRFVHKKIINKKPTLQLHRFNVGSNEMANEIENKEQNSDTDMMTTSEKINAMGSILATPNVKRIKKDKGLIERTESSTTILTEDNKELLKD